jgi:hypothetical protein
MLYHFGHGEPARKIALRPALVFPAIYCDHNGQAFGLFADWCKWAR